MRPMRADRDAQALLPAEAKELLEGALRQDGRRALGAFLRLWLSPESPAVTLIMLWLACGSLYRFGAAHGGFAPKDAQVWTAQSITTLQPELDGLQRTRTWQRWRESWRDHRLPPLHLFSRHAAANHRFGPALSLDADVARDQDRGAARWRGDAAQMDAAFGHLGREHPRRYRSDPDRRDTFRHRQARLSAKSRPGPRLKLKPSRRRKLNSANIATRLWRSSTNKRHFQSLP